MQVLKFLTLTTCFECLKNAQEGKSSFSETKSNQTIDLGKNYHLYQCPSFLWFLMFLLQPLIGRASSTFANTPPHPQTRPLFTINAWLNCLSVFRYNDIIAIPITDLLVVEIILSMQFEKLKVNPELLTNLIVLV